MAAEVSASSLRIVVKIATFAVRSITAHHAVVDSEQSIASSGLPLASRLMRGQAD